MKFRCTVLQKALVFFSKQMFSSNVTSAFFQMIENESGRIANDVENGPNQSQFFKLKQHQKKYLNFYICFDEKKKHF